MINVITRNVASDASDDLKEQISKEVWNTKADRFAMEVRNGVRNKRCEKHPNADQTITILATQQGLQVEKKFCCPEFSELIPVNVTRS
ncbi:MAG: hypothetical protein IPI10_08130 [Bacteroidetes bacterium]|jgi:hypothetical protein|nr:hypothetical protein [Bacteroidota bacterium]MBK7571576.1 hypothetical protein [Bacteroidota bacterium]MBP9790924.1 hypothetical protein [Bacteroidia bacterium]